MITILNFSPTDLTHAQHRQIVDSIIDQADARYICVPPRSRVLELRPRRTLKATVDAIPLTEEQWRTLPVIPFVPDSVPFARGLLDEINRRRGYAWPVVRVVETQEKGENYE